MGFNFNGDSFNIIYRVNNYIQTEPPPEKYKVKNLYVDPLSGRLTVEYEDTPMEE